ncbi:hypothetical protein [Kitasatospora sp. NPDC089509]|uniref:hypothetical protein n=1 Tax=Kitasatospora sp. NPDC089509 TaxID=3364079 RepID=UPI003815E442
MAVLLLVAGLTTALGLLAVVLPIIAVRVSRARLLATAGAATVIGAMGLWATTVLSNVGPIDGTAHPEQLYDAGALVGIPVAIVMGHRRRRSRRRKP